MLLNTAQDQKALASQDLLTSTILVEFWGTVSGSRAESSGCLNIQMDKQDRRR